MRKTDDKGNFTETYDEYIARVAENSEEYRNVIAICNWIDEASQGLIFAKDVSTDYTDKSLEFEIRKAVLTKGVKYVFYDTLKNETSSVGEWSSFKITTTKLSEIAKQLRIFLYGSIQLTDSANDYESDMLNSNNIAEAKSIKHVLDTLVLYKEIPNASLGKYYYLSQNDDWGEFVPTDLRKDRRIISAMSIKTDLVPRKSSCLRSILTAIHGVSWAKFSENKDRRKLYVQMSILRFCSPFSLPT